MPEIQVLVNGQEQVLKTFKQKWFYFNTSSKSFEIHSDSTKSFQIPSPGRYVFYDSELVSIKSNPSSILLVSDLDNTIFNETEKGLEYYKNFIKFWLIHFEFNGSFLVYNTGRSMPDYLEDIHRLYKPDMILMYLSTYAYVLDEFLGLKEDPGLRKYNSAYQHDWNTDLFNEALCEKYGISRDSVVRSYETYLLIKLEKNFALEKFKEIRTFARNKEKKCIINGSVFHAEIVIIKFNLVNERFYEIRPLFVGKGNGLRFAQKKFGFFDEDVFTAGDSPNDIDSLKVPVHGIVMKNGEELLLEWFGKKYRKHLVVSQKIGHLDCRWN
jgi:HAD superfamily hydrolase (TIGR01484 family)